MSTDSVAAVDTTTVVHPDELNHYYRNVRRGDVAAIARSLAKLKQYKPITVNIGTRTGRPNEVLAGNHTLMAIRELAHRHPDEPAWRQVKVHWVDEDEATCKAINIADNRTAELGSYDEAALVELLTGMPTEELFTVGYSTDDVESLRHSITDFAEVDKALADASKATPKKRTVPLDMAFSFTNFSVARAAYYIGWGPGVISSRASTSRWRTYLRETPKGTPMMLLDNEWHSQQMEQLAAMEHSTPLLFMDNEWHDYDHAEHLAAVAEFKPKYATTRDIMTKQQCATAGVQFYTFDEIMDQAAEIAAYVPNVIVIPKHNIIDKIPDTINGARVVLGYSVPSSYGRTDIVPEMFRGHPIHLLGGSWKSQRGLLSLLGDDVVSLDMNQMVRIAEFGQVVNRDGGSMPLSDIPAMGGGKYRTWIASMMVSLTVIMNEVVEMFGVEPALPAERAITDRDLILEH